MEMSLTFDDVLIVPKFSTIQSRSNVSLRQEFLGMHLDLPVISSNMDTVTNSTMAVAMSNSGAIGALHRFSTIEENCYEYEKSVDAVVNSSRSDNRNYPIVSVGVGEKEYKRAMALSESGARVFLIDVAHGAALHVVNQYDLLRSRLPNNSKIIVGNFANNASIQEFLKHVKSKTVPDAIKVGIGGGSLCTTRVVTGVGDCTYSSIIDCAKSGISIIADGGIRNSGDVAKALGAGAKVVMLGRMLAGTDESPGEIIYTSMSDARQFDGTHLAGQKTAFKKYRGSASSESYSAQGKNSDYISPEGESSLVPYVGPLSGVLQQIAGGLRSALSYTNSRTLSEFRSHVEFKQITHAGSIENSAHGKV